MTSLAFFVFFLFGSVTVFLFQHEIQKAAQLPFLGKVNEFTLTDARGQPFSLQQLKNKVWIADFIFTTCGNICPIMTKNMSQLHRSFQLVEDAALVSITVNPEYDTSEVLAHYAQKYNADMQKWYFLTGPREKIQQIAVESFKIGSVEEPIFHSAYFILVDRQGRIRGYYDGTNQEEINRLYKDTAALVK